MGDSALLFLGLALLAGWPASEGNAPVVLVPGYGRSDIVRPEAGPADRRSPFGSAGSGHGIRSAGATRLAGIQAVVTLLISREILWPLERANVSSAEGFQCWLEVAQVRGAHFKT